MITIIHGENIAESRKYYLLERDKYPNKIIFEGGNLLLTDFIQAVSNAGLFGDQQAVFIEDLLSKKKGNKDIDLLIAQISNTVDVPVFIWESKDLTTKQLASFKDANVKQFKIPQTVFAFLDSFLPKNGKKCITLLHELLQEEDINYVLFMLQRQVRILLSLQTDKNTNIEISEIKRMAPWQKGKSSKQSHAFTQDALVQLHTKLYQLELGQKTGGLNQPLEQEIDFLLLSM